MSGQPDTAHPLLRRQIARHLGADSELASLPGFANFVAAIDSAYGEADRERSFLEHSLGTVSEELAERYERLQRSEQSYRQLFERHPLPLLIIDPSTFAIVEVNEAATLLYGWSQDEFSRLTYTDLLHNGATPQLPEASGVTVSAGHETREGGAIDIELTGHPVVVKGEPAVLVCAVDVTRRRAAEAAREHSMSLLQATLEATGDGVLVADLSGRVTSCNRRFLELWGLEEADVIDADARDVVARLVEYLVHPVDLANAFDTMLRDPRVQQIGLLDLTDGRVFERSSRPQRLDGEIVGRVWCIRDVTDRVRLEKELAHQAFHDALTGLPNRAHFAQRAAQALAAAENHPERVAIVVVDLDGFKSINDTFGHGSGDELLSHVAKRLLNATRGCDTVARLGGDEFAVLIEHVRKDADLEIIGQRILNALEVPFAIAQTSATVGVSVGMARGRDETFEEGGAAGNVQTAGDNASESLSPYDSLFRDADLAMYEAKTRGKHRFVLFEPALKIAAMERFALEAALQGALERSEFFLVYQPIIDLDEQRPVGFEALIRWRHPERGIVPPLKFIDIAEETGLIVPIGRWVLREACRQAAIWSRRTGDRQLSMTVNVSGRQLRDDSFVADVREALASSGLSPSQLVLELTESTVIDQPEAVLRRLTVLRDSGVALAVDDFGTGYSALSYLQKFPIDVLKIDKSFVDHVALGGSHAALASAIVALGSALSLRTIAEGVESSDQEHVLRGMGCRLGQGFLFSKPQTPDELDHLFRGSAVA